MLHRIAGATSSRPGTARLSNYHFTLPSVFTAPGPRYNRFSLPAAATVKSAPRGCCWRQSHSQQKKQHHRLQGRTSPAPNNNSPGRLKPQSNHNLSWDDLKANLADENCPEWFDLQYVSNEGFTQLSKILGIPEPHFKSCISRRDLPPHRLRSKRVIHLFTIRKNPTTPLRTR